MLPLLTLSHPEVIRPKTRRPAGENYVHIYKFNKLSTFTMLPLLTLSHPEVIRPKTRRPAGENYVHIYKFNKSSTFSMLPPLTLSHPEVIRPKTRRPAGESYAQWFNFSMELKYCPSLMELKYCPSLKWNETNLHPQWLQLWKHVKQSKKWKHRESYYWNSQRNSHRQEMTSFVSAFLPHTCKDRSRLNQRNKHIALIATKHSFSLTKKPKITLLQMWQNDWLCLSSFRIISNTMHIFAVCILMY